MPAPAPAPAPAAAPSPAAQEISVRVGRVQGSGFEIFWLFVLEFPRAGLSLDRLRDEKLRLVGFQSILRRIIRSQSSETLHPHMEALRSGGRFRNGVFQNMRFC